MVNSNGRLWCDDDPVMLRRLATVQKEANRRGLVIGDDRDRLIYHAAQWDTRMDRRLDLSWLLFAAFSFGAVFAYLLSTFLGWSL